MTSSEKFSDDLVNQLVRTAIVLKRETSFSSGAPEVVPESCILGTILASYFKNSGRRIAETAYAALEEAGLAVEALAFSELWRRSNPEQNDLWTAEEEDKYGN